MLTARKIDAGELLLVSSSLDIRDSVLSDTIVQRNCSLHVHGSVKGTLTIEPGADVLVEGSVDGKIINRGGRLAVQNKPLAECVRVDGPPEDAAGGVLKINLTALASNWDGLAKRTEAECAAVVKADAYGCGIDPITATLAKSGCKTFFVALLDEALKLRTVAPDAAIYVLNGLNPGTADAFRDIDARPVLGSMLEVEEWDAAARAAKEPLPAAIHIDTGMSRHGITADEANALAAKLKSLAFKPRLVMSHFARADEAGEPMTLRQIADFKALAAKFPGTAASLANSAGILAHPDSRFDLVRPGISLYGGRALIEGDNPMKPVVRLDVKIVQVRKAKAGDSVGYGGEFKLSRDSRLAVISAGIGIGAWALIALRSRLPRGRFLVFGAGSAGAIFGCAALAGEVGLVPPVAWFAIVMGAMIGVAAIATRSGRPKPRTA